MIARFAYLTSPSPNVFVLNIQIEGKDGIERFEISKAHLANILITGTALALQEQYPRVPETSPTESADHVRAEHGA